MHSASSKKCAWAPVFNLEKACMSKPLSMYLPERLASAVEGGMSRGSAAKLLSVAPSTAIKWVDQKRRTGSVRTRAQGCDHRSHRTLLDRDETTLASESHTISTCCVAFACSKLRRHEFLRL